MSHRSRKRSRSNDYQAWMKRQAKRRPHIKATEQNRSGNFDPDAPWIDRPNETPPEHRA